MVEILLRHSGPLLSIDPEIGEQAEPFSLADQKGALGMRAPFVQFL